MSVLNIEGQPLNVLQKAVGYEDIPSDLNKAYMMALDGDGGIGAKLGGSYDPVFVSGEQTLTADNPLTGGKDLKSWLILGGAVLFFFIILKVAK